MELRKIDARMELRDRISAIVERAHNMLVESAQDVSVATEATRGIKTLNGDIKEFFEPMRLETKAAYDAVLAERKEYTDPLDAAEREIKGKILTYQREAERRAREQEVAMKKAALEEAMLKERLAKEAEEKGDVIGAEMYTYDAEQAKEAFENAGVIAPKTDAKGMSRRAKYEITEIDPSLVPVELNGVVLRPVDTRAVLDLIRASKGTIKIDGIKYEDVGTITIRG